MKCFYIRGWYLGLVISSCIVTVYIYCSKSMDQPGKVVNPDRSQLIRENGYFPVLVRA